MRYLYRPHRGCLDESIMECIVCKSADAIKDRVIADYAKYGVTFTRDDVVIDDKKINDERIGWRESQYVCVKHMGGEVFDVPQCVGMCCGEDCLPEGFVDEMVRMLEQRDALDIIYTEIIEGSINEIPPGLLFDNVVVTEEKEPYVHHLCHGILCGGTANENTK